MMSDAQIDGSAAKAGVFFERAEQVAQTGNWDFAIELYLEGIRRDMSNIERGHQPLREVSLKRKAQGGKGPGMMESLKRRAGKDPIENLINTEYLLAKEPGSSNLLVAMLKATQALEQVPLIDWVGKILLDALHQGKRNKNTLVFLAQAFDDIEEYESAIIACRMAQQLAPDDSKIARDIKTLGAKATIKQGKYEEAGDFTKGVKDMDRQKSLAQDAALVKGADFLRQQIDQARQAYLESPEVASKVNVLIDALLKTQDPGDENEAIDVLTKAHADTGVYQFKARIGDVKIRQMTNRYRKLVAAEDKPAAIEQAKQLLAFELAEYTDRAANYPTDLSIKYELGKRQFLSGNYDDAIGSLQQAQRDPRRHLSALNYLGQAFAKKQWYPEAAETYQRALEAEVPDSRKKDIWYNLANIYEKMDQLDKAQDLFSELAQTDFNYRDVRDRLDGVRKKIQAKESGQSDSGQ